MSACLAGSFAAEGAPEYPRLVPHLEPSDLEIEQVVVGARGGDRGGQDPAEDLFD